MKDKIIFLDIDGVLNSQRFYETIDKVERIEKRDQYGEMFDPISAKLLNELITTTGAKVVVSSVWRNQGLKAMQQMWIDRKMCGEVVGITPRFHGFSNNVACSDLSIPRGLEIQWYYEKNHNFRHWNWDGPYVQEEKAKCTLETYVIFDDDSDMLYEQRNNFVHCNNMTGLTEPEYAKALVILQSNPE